MERKYQIDTLENKCFLKDIRDGLLLFGKQFPAEDGSAYYLGDDGTPWKERNRETWITSRMAHVYSMGHLLGNPESGALADQALKGLGGALKDVVNGGWYAGITQEGNYMPTKQCYAHAFVILAATSGVLSERKGAKTLLKDALTVYNQYFWDEDTGLAYDTWNTEFTKLDTYRGLNANMHSVEAFLAVADATGNDAYRRRAGRIIEHVLKWAKNNSYRIPEHFSENWNADLSCNSEKRDDPFKPYGATPGHGMEWARLICQWACSAKEEGQRDVYIQEAQMLYKTAIKDAWNVDGAPGIAYTTDWNGIPVVRDRMHWTLAEAINTSAVLYRITGDNAYANQYAEFMKYLDEIVLDHEKGSWYHQLDEKNHVKTTVWPGKSDLYHAVQATLIPYSAVEVSVAAAIKRKLVNCL